MSHGQPPAQPRSQRGPLCDCGSEHASWRGDRAGHRQYLCAECWLEQHLDCIRDLMGVINDIGPQLHSVVLQDYERLNRGMMNAERLLHIADQNTPNHAR